MTQTDRPYGILSFLLGLIVAVFCLPVSGADPTTLPEPARHSVNFDQEILPLFKSKCFECHDGSKQKGGLRLDQKETALQGGDSGRVILPGDSGKSRLIHLVAGLEPDLWMPAKGARLTPAEVGLLRAWIDQGAVWSTTQTAVRPEKHWSFRPVQRPPIPAFSRQSGMNPIDAFIQKELKAKKITFSPEADRRTLLRRLSFDLLGLPATPEAIQSFASDPRKDAYERRVDELLSSPHYGERWGRHWLDVVRFAESHGFEMNNNRPNAWPYRDYVIRSFNEDKPYDRFVMEQLAGDGFGADEATAFLVAGPWDMVKSPDMTLTQQQRMDELHDMVSTAGATFLGLTVGCARCHNHKFDPISQVDYYAMQAVFAGVQHGERTIRTGDYEARAAEAKALRRQLDQLNTELASFLPLAKMGPFLFLDDEYFPPQKKEAPTVTVLHEFSARINYADGTAPGQLKDVGSLQRLPSLGKAYTSWGPRPAGTDLFSWNPQLEGNFRIWVSWGSGFSTHSQEALYVLDLDGDLSTRTDQEVLAKVDQRFFADGSGPVAGQALWSGFKNVGVKSLTPKARLLLRAGEAQAPVNADLVFFEPDADANNSLAGTRPHFRAPVNSRLNTESFAPVQARWVRFTVVATSDVEPCLDELEVFTAENSPRLVSAASFGTKATSSGNYANDEKHKLEHVHDGRYGNARSWISNQGGKGWVQFEFPGTFLINRIVWSRDRDPGPSAFTDRLVTRYKIEVAEREGEWKTVASSDDRVHRSLCPPNPVILQAQPQDGPRLETLYSQVAALEKKIRNLEAFPVVYGGRFESPSLTFRLHRGDPMQKREVVAPATLGQFRPLLLSTNASDLERRTALANWMVDPQNPLTARVMVNRIWHYHFGQGLVSTPSDFGINGARPTHPELLDWLAAEFMENGWSVKHIHRLILNSRTFKQSSVYREDAAKMDAGTQFYWRFPARRLEAEAIRDLILSVSGNLDVKMGGPGFDLFEPNNNYVKVYQSKEVFGPAEWRRMVYQAKPRMQLDAIFGAFDCPDAGQITPKRNNSTTPLQALNLLNSRFILQQADILAARVRREAGEEPVGMVSKAFWLCFGRAPNADEKKEAVQLVAQEGLPALARALFNASEFIMIE